MHIFFFQIILLYEVRKNKFVEILPISVGCLGVCTYSKRKHARGRLGSYTIHSLISNMTIIYNVCSCSFSISVCLCVYVCINLVGLQVGCVKRYGLLYEFQLI